MQIVIDIPEELYKANHRGLEAEELWDLRVAIKNGTPLPKGHGDLVDRNNLLTESYCTNNWMGNEISVVDVMTVEMADAIIEADKAESEG